MDNQKLENLLNLSLNATPEERDKSPDLMAGFDTRTQTWTLIIKYLNSLSVLEPYNIPVVELSGNYAIIEAPESLIDTISALPEIIYVEKPKDLYFTVLSGRRASCVSAVQTGNLNGLNLFGRGCIIGIVDSGIDYANPVFRNPDGSSRILGIWDQTVPGTPPAGFRMGTYYEQQQINEALQAANPSEQQQIVNSIDTSGHGTAVASVAAGNFSENLTSNLGMATQSDLLIVKLGRPAPNSFPRTSELMQAIDFIVKKAIELKRPLALNLSFGNNYGSHKGTSLLETYINEAASLGISSIIIGTGNEGASASHTSGTLADNQTSEIELLVAPFELSLNVQIWKNYYDDIIIEIESPEGSRVTLASGGPASYRYQLDNTEILIYYGEPNPYNLFQEIYINFIPGNTYITQGLWRIILTGIRIVDGEYQLWLPVQSSLNGSRFVTPVPYGTLTIPSTASQAIAVGAYDSRSLSYASFSGRGYEGNGNYYAIFKPDLVAPGVDITTAAPGGTFSINSGTSMAAPFVTGAAAMLMEWGIIKGNDPFLYGEKLKAYLIRGARPLPGIEVYPNPMVGYGALCVRGSLPV